MIAQRRIPHKEEAFFFVASSRPHATRCEDDNLDRRIAVLYDKARDYWINSLIVATVARMISEGRAVQSGLYFLADAVDPLDFMAELQRAGIRLTEWSEASDADSGN